MRLIFNDGQEIVTQSVELQADGSLLVKTISTTEDNLERMFEDKFATKKLTAVERGSTLGIYENYTNLDAIVKYTAGILGVVLFKDGETPAERLDAAETAVTQTQMDMQMAIAELTMLIASMTGGAENV